MAEESLLMTSASAACVTPLTFDDGHIRQQGIADITVTVAVVSLFVV